MTDWAKIKATVSSIIPKKSVINEVLVADNEDSDDLVEVVKKWDDLKDTCEKHGLKEAVDKLNEIFPVLIKVEK